MCETVSVDDGVGTGRCPRTGLCFTEPRQLIFELSTLPMVVLCALAARSGLRGTRDEPHGERHATSTRQTRQQLEQEQPDLLYDTA